MIWASPSADGFLSADAPNDAGTATAASRTANTRIDFIFFILNCTQHLFGVALGLHVTEDPRNLPFFDQESRSRHPHRLLAVHVLFLHHPIGIGDGLVG